MKTPYKPSFVLRQRPWLSALVAFIYLGQIFAPIAFAGGPITADPNAGANRPTIDTSANGVPVINIVRPNDKGISHNKYQDFNVPNQGAILNNAGTETNTQLAGWIDKNNNFNPNDAARLILNEVTGANASRLNGYLEVAGQRADVIIANPNGIYGSNFGFINTSRAMLTTGRPEFDETGNLRSFAVRGGKVVINGSGEGDYPNLGVYATLTDQFDILARAVEINAQVFAKKLNIVTGANRVKYDTLGTEKIAADANEETPLVALDVAALGGMYANRIRLVGTEAGLGVNTRGDIAAGIDGFTLTSEGRVIMSGKVISDAAIDINAREGIASNGTLHAAENTTLATQGAIENTGLLASQKDVVLTADGSIKNSGIVAAGLDANGNFTNENASITATAGTDLNATDGEHYAGRNITLTANSLDLTRATTQTSDLTITARSGDVIHRDARLGADNFTVTTPGTFDNSGGQINATSITITAGGFANDNQGIIAQTGGGTLGITIADTFTNIGGTISSFGSLAITANTFNNTTGYIAALNDATFTTRNGFNNTGGQLLSEGNLAITNLAGDFKNLSGIIQSVDSLTLQNQSNSLDNTDGHLLASGSLSLLSDSLDNTGGNLISDSAIALTLAGNFANTYGVVAGASDITVTAASLDNSHGAIDANGKLTALVTDALNNTDGQLIARTGELALDASSLDNTDGFIATGTALNLDLTNALNNTDGVITAAGDLGIRAGSIINTGELSSTAGAATVTATAGDIANTGIIYAFGPLSLSAESGAISNTGTDAAFSTASSLTLTARSLDNTNAQIGASENINITLTDASATLVNDGGYISAGDDLRITTPGALNNDNGSITATQGNLTLAITGPITNTGLYARIASGNTLTLTTSGQLDNTGGAIFSEGDLTIKTGTAALINQSGYIGTTGTERIANVILNTGAFDNTQGVITSTGLLTLTAATLTNNGIHAQIHAADNASITLTGDLKNVYGSISTGGKLALDLNGLLDNTAGQILSDGNLTIITHNGTIDNTLGYIGGNADAALEANTLNNTVEGVITFGGTTDITLTGSLINTDDAQILSAGKITLTAAAVDNRYGILKSGTGIEAAISGNWNNGDFGILIAGDQGINITASDFDNNTGIIRSTGSLTFGIAGNFDNTAGEIVTDRSANITAASITNALGVVSANDALTVSATAGNLDNRLGSLSAGSSATITVRDDILNGGGFIMGDGILISARSLDNAAGYIGSTATANIALSGTLGNRDEGAIAANNDLIITAASIDNTDSGTAGGIFSNENIALTTTSGALDNTGGAITALGNATLTLHTDLRNTGGALSTGGNLTITARQIDNTSDGYIATNESLTANLTGNFDNSAGTVITASNASMDAATFKNNDDGFVQAGGDLSITAANGIENHAGTLRALGDQTLTAGGGTLDNTGGVIQAVGDLTVSNTTTASLNNTSGYLTASGTLTIANLNARLVNAGGVIAGGDNGSIAIQTSTIDTAGGAIVAGNNLSLNIASGDFAFDGTHELWANNNLALTLQNGAFTNSSTDLLAYGVATINASGNITNNAGAILNAGGLNLVSSGTILNYGRIDADYIFTNSDFLDNRSVIMGDAISLDARELRNTGAGALIASRNYLALFVTDLFNTRDSGAGAAITGANIYTAGDLVIAGRGGVDESGNPVAQARRILNSSSSIEARGSATLSALEIINQKDQFETAEVEVARKSVGHWQGGERGYDLYRKYIDPNGSDNYWLAYTRVTYETQITSDSPEARILAGGSINFAGSQYLGNAYSTIAAGGNIDIGGVTYVGTETQFNRTDKYYDVRVEYRKRNTLGKWKYRTGDSTTLPDVVELLAKAGASLTANDTLHGSDVTIHNGVRNLQDAPTRTISEKSANAVDGAGIIDGHSQTDNSSNVTVADNDLDIGGVDTDKDTSLAAVTPPTGDGSEGLVPGGKTLPTMTITAPGEVDFTTPQNPLYSVVTDPEQPYLIVTDPRFTSWDNYISSDYFMQRLGADPTQMHKRLGDGYYENLLILDQISALTGLRYLGDYRSDDEQFKGLMDNAVGIAESHQLRPGIALSTEQIASLDKDIVWMVETIVDGQTVLAPVVYLSSATRATLESGAVIAATDIDLSLTGDLSNRGTIRADRDMRLQAANILNDGGNLKSGGDMTLVAKTDITSLAGNITSGGDATLVAGRDIRLASVAETETFGVNIETRVRDQSLSAGGSLVMQAGRDLTLTGVDTSVGGDASLVAGRDLSLDTVKSVNRHEVTYGGGFAKMETVEHTLTTLDVGGNLALRAGTLGGDGTSPTLGNINIVSAQLQSGGDMSLAATGNIDVTAVKDRVFTDSQVSSKGFMSSRTKRTMRDDETVLGAAFVSGGNVAISAGDESITPGAGSGNISIASGYVNAGGAVTVAATNDITLTTTTEHHETLTESSRKRSSVTSTKTKVTRDHTIYDAEIGAVLSGDTVAVQSGRDINVQGSSVVADNDILLKAANDINITAATENYSSEHYSKTTKSGILGGGLTSISVGSQSLAIGDTSEGTLAKSALVGSSEGRVNLIAGNDANIVGSNLVSQAGIGIDAANINITAAAQTDTSTYTEQYRQSGVSLAIRGGPVESLYLAQGKNMQGGEESDARMDNIQGYMKANGWLMNSDGLASGGASPMQSSLAVTSGNRSNTISVVQENVTHVGSTLQTDGDIALIARGRDESGGDINVIGSYLSAGDALAMQAARDINILESLDTQTSAYSTKAKDTTTHLSGVFSNQDGTSDQNATQTAANGSILTADNVTMIAGQDIAIRGSTIAADNDINLDAVRDVRIEAATEKQTATFEQKQRTDGMFDSGRVAVTFGQQNIGFEQDEDSTYAVGSLIGTTGGSINIRSGGETRIVGSELFSQTGIGIDADSISILAAAETYSSSQKQKSSEGGLTVQVRGGVVDLAMSIVESLERADDVQDDRLSALYAARAVRQGKALYDTLNPSNGGTPEISVEIAASIGAKSSQSQSTSEGVSFLSSSLSTDGDITLVARGEGGGVDSGNIHIAGSDLTGANVTLGAANNILIESAADAYMNDGKNSNQGWAAGVAFGIGTNGMGLSVFAEGQKGKGYEKGDGTSYLNSHINAADTLTLISGGDTSLIGATASGNRIVADIGGDLNLVSQQSRDYYDAKQEQMSGKVQVSVMGGGGGASASYNKSHTTSDYLSVVEQTGLFAGEDGFQINVGGNTSLVGAVIGSTADPSKNFLSTETITFSDLENHAKYDAGGFGVSASYGWGGSEGKNTPDATAGQQGNTPGSSFTPGLSLTVRQEEDASSVTRSAISEGTIIVRSDYDENGERIRDSLVGLSTDVSNASGVLENKFDLEKIRTNQELGQLVGEEGFNLVGTISEKIHDSKYNQIKKDYAEGTISDEEYDRQIAGLDLIWGEGGVSKTALHTGMGALQAAFGGGDVLGGALGAGTGELIKGTDAFASLGNSTLGNFGKNLASMGVGYLAGGDSGASTALDGDKYNRELHQFERDKIKEIAERYAEANGLNAKDVERQLILVAEALVHTGEEGSQGSRTEEKLAQNAAILANADGSYTWALDLLTSEKGNAQAAWKADTTFAFLKDGNPDKPFSFQQDVIDKLLSLDVVDQGSPHYFLEYGTGWMISDAQASSVRGNAEAQSDFYQRYGIEEGASATFDAAWAVGTTPVRWGSALGELGGNVIGNEIALQDALLSGDPQYYSIVRGLVADDYISGGKQFVGAIDKVGTILGEETINIAYDPSRINVIGGNAYDFWLENPGSAHAIMTDSAFGAIGLAETGVSIYNELKLIKNSAATLANSADDAARIVGKDLPYDSRTIRTELDALYGKENVTSTTVPPTNAPNVKLAGQRHPITEVPFDDRGFPIFEKYTKYDTKLPTDAFKSASYEQQMQMASKDLWTAIQRGEVSSSQFTTKQLEQIQAGAKKIDGFTWHHHQDTGRMQLVPAKVHADTNHIGGNSMSKGQ